VAASERREAVVWVASVGVELGSGSAIAARAAFRFLVVGGVVKVTPVASALCVDAGGKKAQSRLLRRDLILFSPGQHTSLPTKGGSGSLAGVDGR
jgi:hypothetical protein